MNRLGIFGGTFDPVHYGHIRPLIAAKKELALNRVLLVPNPNPPHKHRLKPAPYEHRRKMLGLAFADEPDFEVSDLEKEARGPAYTIETLRFLKSGLAEKTELWLIIGADSLLTLPNWREPGEILQIARIAVLPRPGVDLNEALWRDRVRMLNTPLVDISATVLRDQLASGADLSDRIPLQVLDYLRKNRLYGT